jgi:hypothetical protein
MNTDIINREAADKTKGFRLQKLRAVNLALDELENRSYSNFYLAMEQDEDVSKIVSAETDTMEYLEEDKHYPDTNFTINSYPILNSLVSFFDQFVGRWRRSSNILFGFYTTAEIGKERSTALSKSLLIEFPKNDKILELIQKDEISDDVIGIVKNLLIHEYEEQYKKRDSDGNLNELRNSDKHLFKQFLKSIKWFFGKEDNEALRELALSKIRKCEFFNFRLDGKESYLLSEIMDHIEKRQGAENFSERYIDKFQIELIFKKAESVEGSAQQDSAWKAWEVVCATDSRNLKEKIHAVCPSFDEKQIGLLTRRACYAKIDEKQSGKNYLSLKYRILESCDDAIYGHIRAQSFSEERIQQIIEDLTKEATKNIEELKKDFNYPIGNSHSIKAIVIDLFDSCYISFD